MMIFTGFLQVNVMLLFYWSEFGAVAGRRRDRLVHPGTTHHVVPIRVHALVRRCGGVNAKLVTAETFATPIALEAISARGIFAWLGFERHSTD
jgi:hypothetical protein